MVALHLGTCNNIQFRKILGGGRGAVINSSAKRQRGTEKERKDETDEPMKKQRKLYREKSSIREGQQREATKITQIKRKKDRELA